MKLLKHKNIKPSVYAIELVSIETSFLFLTTAYTLEDAVFLAKQKILQESTKAMIPLSIWSLKKYTYMSLEECIINNSEFAEIYTKQYINKNQLMKQIIDTQNHKLFNDNIRIFTEAEKKLLKIRLLKNDIKTE